jgi:hypothetical protein
MRYDSEVWPCATQLCDNQVDVTKVLVELIRVSGTRRQLSYTRMPAGSPVAYPQYHEAKGLGQTVTLGKAIFLGVGTLC